MKTLAVISLSLLLTVPALGITFNVNTDIGASDYSYDEQDIVVNNCIVTIDGSHTFNNLQILNGGTLTHTANTPNPMSLTILQNAYVDSLSSISADGKGYGSGVGPGKGSTGTSYGGGGGYGGMGGEGYIGASGGNVYGSITEPSHFGSGGGEAASEPYPLGGNGGGSIRLTVIGTLSVDGVISSGGTNPPVFYEDGGGGAGGSIYLSVDVLEGMGTICANGAAASSNSNSGGGAGGRIAVYYNNKTNYWGNILASGEPGTARGGGAGTIFMKSNSEPLGHLFISNDNLDGALTPLPSSFSCLDVIISDFGKLDINTAAILTVTDGVTVDNGGFLYIHSTLTLPYLHVLPGGEVGHVASRTGFNLIIQGDVNVESGGMISANGKGYATGVGPGKGGTGTSRAGGGGYGGKGGNASDGTLGGNVYGNIAEPILFGSGGGLAASQPYPLGGSGGGIIRMTVTGTLHVDGVISSNGGNPPANYYDGGGGSGGSVYLSVGILDGMGTIEANGGLATDTNSGGGGGGRIAVYTATNTFIGNVLVNGGTGYNNGQLGTIHYGPSDFGCGDAAHPHPVGDLHPDCRVDLLDFAILAEHWLEDTN